MISEAIKQRFLQDADPARLGALAADLARVASFATSRGLRQAVAGLLEESKWFIEWTAPGLPPRDGRRLAELQVILALVEREWNRRAGAPAYRDNVSHWARRWCEEVLSMKGANP